MSAVQKHLSMVLYKTGEELTKMETLDLDRAKTTVAKQIKINLRKKITEEDLQHWTKLAADLVGMHPDLQKRKQEPHEKKMKMNAKAEQPTEKSNEATNKLTTVVSQKDQISSFDPKAKENALTEQNKRHRKNRDPGNTTGAR